VLDNIDINNVFACSQLKASVLLPSPVSVCYAGALNVSECYRHLWLRSIPTHYAVFALFVLIVFVVNLVYVLVKRGHHTVGGNHNENHGLTDDSDRESDHVTHWTMPSVSGWNAPSVITLDSERADNEVLPLLMSPVAAKP